MKRLLPVLFSSLILAAPFATSAANTATLRATLATAPDERVVIVRRAPWRCDGNACVSDDVRSRPAIACGAIARELGAVTAFAVDAVAFSDEELATCNQYAR